MNAPTVNPAITQPPAPVISHDALRLSAKLVALVAPFMAQPGEIRHYLSAINVRPHPEGGAVIAATNGHILGAVRDRDATCNYEVTLRVAARTVTACAARASDDRTLLMLGGRLAVVNGCEEICIQAGDPVVSDTFPRYENVVPAAARLKPGLVGNFDARLLPLLDKVSKVLMPSAHAMRAISFHTVDGAPNNAAVARLSDVPDFVAVLMPLRDIAAIHSLPSWTDTMAKQDDLVAVARAAA